jgi:hypothetical protein
MTKIDRDKVVEIIVNKPNFNKRKTSRRVFIQNKLGLKAELKSFDFDGIYNTIVWDC